MNDFLWVEKYRPKKVSECILPGDLLETFSNYVIAEQIPNMLLSGGPGIGKTTVAKALCNEIGADVLVINGSMNGNIDTLRTEIKDFASTVSFSSSRKYVILDEADYLNAQSTQPALRNFMEEFSKNCGFILTCNFKNRIIEPLQSRCSVVDFTIPKDSKVKMAADFFKRVCGILDTEGVEYNKKVVADVVQNYFPDFRRVLNELQRYSSTGKIDTGIFINKDSNIDELINLLKSKKYEEMRKWAAQNNDIDNAALYRKIYDQASKNCKPQSIPQLVVTLADYQYKAAFVADQEINNVACFTELMMDVEWQ